MKTPQEQTPARVHPASRLWAACAFFVLGACATAPGLIGAERPENWAQPVVADTGLANLHRVTPTLYRSAQPTKEGLLFLDTQPVLTPGDRPINTVLSLRAFHDDETLAPAGTSLRYEQIRFKTWHPENEDVVKFLRIATTPARQPVLVHCQHGSDRTGTMVAIYRIAVEGWSKEDATREMTQGGFGFHPLWKNLTQYIMDLDVEAIKTEVRKQGSWPP